MTRLLLSASAKGAAGERRAASWLEAGGWTVVARNFRCAAGEIDIVALRGRDLAFVEVKSWSALPRGELGRSVDRRKRSRIARAAGLFLSRRPQYAGLRPRFDVLFVGADGIECIADAFAGEGID
jgi:putative endonuclease